MSGSTKALLAELAETAESLGYRIESVSRGQVALSALSNDIKPLRFIGGDVLVVTIDNDGLNLMDAATLRRVLRPLESA